jgi:hypothetical protein
MESMVTLGDLKARYPRASLALRIPHPEDGSTRMMAYKPTHRIESRLPDGRLIVDYVRLVMPGRDPDLIQAGFDDVEFCAGTTPSDYTILAHGYSVVKVPTFGYSHRSKEWWPYVCPEPAWTGARLKVTSVSYEPLEEVVDYAGASPVQLRGDGVYFAQAASGGPIKIGWSSDARRRRSELQTAQPERLVYLAFIPGSVEDERGYHNRFSGARLEGEWFEPEPVLAWLRARGYVR